MAAHGAGAVQRDADRAAARAGRGVLAGVPVDRGACARGVSSASENSDVRRIFRRLSISSRPVRLEATIQQGGSHEVHAADPPGLHPAPRTPRRGTSSRQEEQGTVYAAYKALNETPGVTPRRRLAPPETATTVRVQDGKTLTTDGPFVELKEAIGGYLLFEADDLDAAIELASKVPAARMGGAIEVRPIAEW